MPNILGLPAILVILLASMILQRLARSWATRAAIKRGAARDLADLQATLFATWLCLPLTLLAFAFCLIFTHEGHVEWPARAPETPDEVFKLVRGDHDVLFGLQSLMGIVLVYLAMQLMGVVGRVTQLTIAKSTAARPGD